MFVYDSIPNEDRTALSGYAYWNHVQRGFQTYLMTRALLAENVPGVLVECGVGFGGMPGAMALALKRDQAKRPIHLFDSFKGIPWAGPKDAEQPGIGKITTDTARPIEQRLTSSGIVTGGCTVADVRQKLDRWGFAACEFHFHEGWFQHTMPGVDIGPIALLRLDADLYESTECALAHLYGYASPQAYVYVDDWALAGCRQAVVDYFIKYPPMPKVELDEWGAAYWRKA